MPSSFTSYFYFYFSEVRCQNSRHQRVEFQEAVQNPPKVKSCQLQVTQNVINLHLSDVSNEEDGFNGADKDRFNEDVFHEDVREVRELGGFLFLHEEFVQDSQSKQPPITPMLLKQKVYALLVAFPTLLLHQSFHQTMHALVYYPHHIL